MKPLSEHSIQSKIVDLCRRTYMLPMFSVPNEAMNAVAAKLRTARNTKRINAALGRTYDHFKLSGLTEGAPDLVILLPDARTLFLECKTPDGKQSPAQAKFQASAEALDHLYRVVRSVEEFEALILELVPGINPAQ